MRLRIGSVLLGLLALCAQLQARAQPESPRANNVVAWAWEANRSGDWKEAARLAEAALAAADATVMERLEADLAAAWGYARIGNSSEAREHLGRFYEAGVSLPEGSALLRRRLLAGGGCGLARARHRCTGGVSTPL